MRDERGGHVVIRLYTPGGMAVYYRIQKTWVVGRTRATHDAFNRHLAPWVALLEKACAYHFLQSNRQYTAMSGAGPFYATDFEQALTGVKASEAFKTLRNLNSELIDLEETRANSTPDAEFLNFMRTTAADLIRNPAARARLKKVFGSASNAEALDFLRNNNNPLKSINYTNKLYRQNASGQDKVIRQNVIRDYLDEYFPALDPATRRCIDHYVASLFPGKRGTGLYNMVQLRAYREIAIALQHHRGVVLSSRSEMGRPEPDLGLNGEHRARGLAGPHAYQVINHRERGNLYELQIRNPWGRYGRSYQVNLDGNLSAAAQAGGTFWLELSDLTKRFSQYTVSDPM